MKPVNMAVKWLKAGGLLCAEGVGVCLARRLWQCQLCQLLQQWHSNPQSPTLLSGCRTPCQGAFCVKCALTQHWTHDTHLDQAANRLAICGHNVLLVCMHNAVALCTAQIVLGHVQVNFIAVKVGIEGVAVGVVHADRTLALQAQGSISLGCALPGFELRGSSVPERT